MLIRGPLGARRGSRTHGPLRQAGLEGLSAGGALPHGAGVLAKPYTGCWGPPAGGSCRGGVARPPDVGQEVSSRCQAASGPGVSAWLQQCLPGRPPLGHLLREAFWGPLTRCFLLQHLALQTESREDSGRAGNKGEKAGASPRRLGTTPTPVAESWLRQVWALGPLRALRGRRGLGGQTDAGVGSASEFGLGHSFRQIISMSHRPGSRGSRLGRAKVWGGWG